eukprot:TRINITY_DN6844_c0_g1_i2.p1 TRINITY_DN6844_c0_g1~~TRINITY_DN6844_c0_g1_i2.p1  ORF type:complete len:738 (-),score=103.42 TRINITY_DN6844_c0_g1_i2:193-2328(-)
MAGAQAPATCAASAAVVSSTSASRLASVSGTQGATKCRSEVRPEEGSIAVVRVHDCQAIDALEWVGRVLRSEGLAWVLSEPGSSTCCVVVADSILRSLALPVSGEVIERGWCSMRVATSSKIGEHAILEDLSELSSVLGAAHVRTRTLSTAGVARLLVGDAQLSLAIEALVRSGHAVGLSPATVPRCLPSLPTSASHLDKDRDRHVGVWTLLSREQPRGVTVERYTEGDGPCRLQCPCGLYAEVRFPATSPGSRSQQHASCAGSHSVVEDDGHVVSMRSRLVSFQPPSGDCPKRHVQFGLDESSMSEVTHRDPSFMDSNDECMEAWSRMDGGPTTSLRYVALELHSVEEPASAPPCETRRPRPAGVWLFAGRHFVRILGLAAGNGLIAGTCCRSLLNLEQLHGAKQVRSELQGHYDVVQGVVEAPGTLRVRRRAAAKGGTLTPVSPPGAGGELLLDIASRLGGTVAVADGMVTHRQPDYSVHRWRVIEWGFDPFTTKVPSVAEITGAGPTPSPGEPPEKRSRQGRSSASGASVRRGNRCASRSSSSGASSSSAQARSPPPRIGGSSGGGSNVLGGGIASAAFKELHRDSEREQRRELKDPRERDRDWGRDRVQAAAAAAMGHRRSSVQTSAHSGTTGGHVSSSSPCGGGEPERAEKLDKERRRETRDSQHSRSPRGPAVGHHVLPPPPPPPPPPPARGSSGTGCGSRRHWQ